MMIILTVRVISNTTQCEVAVLEKLLHDRSLLVVSGREYHSHCCNCLRRLRKKLNLEWVNYKSKPVPKSGGGKRARPKRSRAALPTDKDKLTHLHFRYLLLLAERSWSTAESFRSMLKKGERSGGKAARRFLVRRISMRTKHLLDAQKTFSDLMTNDAQRFLNFLLLSAQSEYFYARRQYSQATVAGCEALREGKDIRDHLKGRDLITDFIYTDMLRLKERITDAETNIRQKESDEQRLLVEESHPDSDPFTINLRTKILKVTSNSVSSILHDAQDALCKEGSQDKEELQLILAQCLSDYQLCSTKDEGARQVLELLYCAAKIQPVIDLVLIQCRSILKSSAVEVLACEGLEIPNKRRCIDRLHGELNLEIILPRVTAAIEVRLFNSRVQMKFTPQIATEFVQNPIGSRDLSAVTTVLKNAKALFLAILLLMDKDFYKAFGKNMRLNVFAL